MSTYINMPRANRVAHWTSSTTDTSILGIDNVIDAPICGCVPGSFLAVAVHETQRVGNVTGSHDMTILCLKSVLYRTLLCKSQVHFSVDGPFFKACPTHVCSSSQLRIDSECLIHQARDSNWLHTCTSSCAYKHVHCVFGVWMDIRDLSQRYESRIPKRITRDVTRNSSSPFWKFCIVPHREFPMT
jgi:hypothetical protein